MRINALRPGLGWSAIIGAVLLLAMVAFASSVRAQTPINTVPELIAAIHVANASGNPATIILEQNAEFVLTEAIADPTVGLDGLPAITGTITIEGNGATIRRSDAEQTPAFHIFRVSTGGTLHLHDLTVTGGFVGEVSAGGGGISNYGVLKLTNSIVRGNEAGLDGGGIWSGSTATLVELTNSDVIDNTAGRHGGGIHNSNSGIVEITGGEINDNKAGESGGGIHHGSGEMILTAITLSNNQADTRGGGIAANGEKLTLTNSTVSKNRAETDGGGIYRTSSPHTDSNAEITNTLVSDNKADGDGGGIANVSANLTLDRLLVHGNRAEGNGGGIHNDGSAGTLTITNSTVTDNSASGNGGGLHSIYALGQPTVTVSNSAIKGNTATGNGGGIYSTSILTLNDSTVAENTATGPDAIGGGIANTRSDAILTLTRSKVLGNSADSGGGGIWAGGTTTATNSVISGNSGGDEGGGIRSDSGVVTLNNSTISGNAADLGGGIDSRFGALILNNSIIWGNASTDRTAVRTFTNNRTIIGTDGCPSPPPHCLSADPLFVNWIDPSAPDWEPTTAGDYRLLPGSPAIDAGDNEEVEDIEKDLAGNDRVVGEFVDLGAYEAQFANLQIELTVTPDPAPLNASVSLSLLLTGGNIDLALVEGMTVTLSGPYESQTTVTLSSDGTAETTITANTPGEFLITATLGALSDTATLEVAARPVLDLPDPVVVSYSRRNNVTWNATATDWKGNTLAVKCSPESGSSFGVGDTDVMCSATDGLDQISMGWFTVTVRERPDPEPRDPRLRNLPGHIVLDAESPDGATLEYDLPTAVDVDGTTPLDVVCEPPSGSFVPIGHTTVVCSTTDSADKTTKASFGVTVRPYREPGIPDLPDFSPLDNIDNLWFWQTWARTDLPVRDRHTVRTWMWGPGPFTESLWEAYAESPNGEREVIYFDKARMEITHPDGDSDDLWYVTNGLLVVEMITGNRQFGDDTFAYYGPAEVNVAGDPDDPNAPTYASLQKVLDAPAQEVGTLLTEQIDRDGHVSRDEGWGAYGVTVGYVDEVTQHGIAGPFWEFMRSEGLVYEDGSLNEDALFENPFYATGRPVTEAYWANVSVGGEPRDVLIQCFERRCLTYTPGNDAGFVVEAGNVGQHYYYWRYVQTVE